MTAAIVPPPTISWRKRFAHFLKEHCPPVFWVMRWLWHLPDRVLTPLLATWWYLWLWLYGHRRIPRAAPLRKRPLVVMLVCSNLPVDPRVEREARALAAHGFRVKVLCPAWDPPTPPPDWGPNVEIGILRATDFYTRFPYVFSRPLLRAALAEDAWAYHSHDLDTALPALVAAARKRVPCLCDFHEWYSENVTWDEARGCYRSHPLLKRWIFQQLERLVLHSASKVITVCDSIARHLERRYDAPHPIHVLRNVPPLRAEPIRQPPTHLRTALGIAADKAIVLYQGGLGPSRNLEPVIRALAMVRHAVLVIRGPGMERFAPGYQRLAAGVGAADKLFCLPPVPSNAVVAEARSADLGLWTLLANVGLNFRLALPNKVFEYLAAGLPLLVADLPEVRRLIDNHGVGLCFDPEDPASIAAAIDQLAGNAHLRSACQRNIPSALRSLNADREWERLVQLYEGLMLASLSESTAAA